MSDQKTEQPTQRRLEKARKEGRFAVSREFVSATQFLLFAWMLSAFGGVWFDQLRQSTRAILKFAVSAAGRDLNRETILNEGWKLLRADVAGPMCAGMVLVAFTVSSQLFTTRLGFAPSKLAPDFGRLNPLPRLKGLPRQNLPILGQSVVLLPVFAWAVWALGKENLEVFERLPLAGLESSSNRVATAIVKLMWRAGWVFLALGVIDLFRQRRRHSQDLRMTKQETRDEQKEAEGSPLIKQRIRRLQRDAARRNMMKEVANATAVIVNPTHFSVALKYSLESAGAPVVVAKGKNYLALRIKQRAIDNNVPVIENQPLAQALYKAVDVGQEIPPHLYRAVAEVLAYIFKLLNGRLPGLA